MRADRMLVDELLPELAATVRRTSAAVLRTPTGSGKTTRVPPALLDSGLAGNGQIIVLEPRRLAARAAARRIAAEKGWQLGHEVGYQVRFDRKAGRNTRILFATEGVLLQFLQSDPFLEKASVVIFDEFHERNLASDLALAMVRQVQREVRPELRIVVMSATLESRSITDFLGDCPLLESEGRMHPLELRYAGAREGLLNLATLPQRVARAVVQAVGETDGDLLVFLPGVGEISRVSSLLEAFAGERGLLIAPLFGDLPAQQQDRALARQSLRRIVLATNVAETSVTVEGVGAVVDSGLVRLLRFDPGTGLDRLELCQISRASAQQRAGRAGREGPGIVYRLWTEHDQRGLQEQTPPEITRVDLAGPVLQLLAWSEPDPAAFPWFEAPDRPTLAHAQDLLEQLNAVKGGAITSEGRRMVQLPLHPRLARLLLEGAQGGVPSRAALLCGLLQERDPFFSRAAEESPSCTCDLDHPLDLLERFAANGVAPAGASSFNPGAARFILRTRDQLLVRLRQVAGQKSGRDTRDHEALQRALLAAFPDRLVRRRQSGSSRGVMVGGRGVKLARESGVRESDLLVAVEISDSRPGERSEALVRRASAVERAWLPAQSIGTCLDVEFDNQRQRVVAFERTRFRDLVIEEREVAVPPEEGASVLAEAAARHLATALDLERPEVASFLARIRWLREWMPELGLPAWGEPELQQLLPALTAKKRSFAELRKAPLLDFLRGALSFRQQQALDREAPERLAMPGGSRVRVQYEPGKPPVLAARIQEVFGLAETPRLAGGRAPVLLHLLAPNFRPQQVTQDLASFWKNTYPEVRKELQGRYPKHAWPEKPGSRTG